MPSGRRFGVDAEHLPLVGRRAECLDEPGGQPLGRVELARAVAVVDEEQVDVGRVRELLAAEASDTDDGERRRRFATVKRGFDARVGDVRELALRRLEIGEAEHVARADAKQVAALEPPQAGGARLRRGATRARRSPRR